MPPGAAPLEGLAGGLVGIGRAVESGFLIGGRYRLIERLGQGGMSVVWRAGDDVLGREVAVKVLSARLAADPAVLHQLREEARAAAGLRHSMVVEVHDYGETTYRGRVLPYVVMELVEGRTMTDLLSGRAIPWRLAVLVCAQVAAALAAAHARGIVHRDVKPGNVMITSSGVKLVDFGISAAVGTMDGTDGQLLGTPAYLAPERIAGGPVRPATDVYALGLLLYLGLAGRMPWQASTTTGMLKAHFHTEPAPLPAVPGLPGEVVRLVRRCLAKKPDQRPTAGEIAHVLGEVAGLPPATLLQAAAVPEVVAAPRRMKATVTARIARVPAGRRTLVAGGVAGVLVAAGLVAWVADDPRTAGPPAAGAAPSQQACTPIGTACGAAPAGPPPPATVPPVARTTAPVSRVAEPVSRVAEPVSPVAAPASIGGPPRTAAPERAPAATSKTSAKGQKKVKAKPAKARKVKARSKAKG